MADSSTTRTSPSAQAGPSTPFVVALACFAVLFAASMLLALSSDSVDFARTHATAWSMTLLATPPMYIFVSRYRRSPRGDWWRMLWSFGWLMNIAHFYFGLFHLHHGDPLSVFTRQGFLLAFSIFFFTLLWGVDVIAAGLRLRWAPPYGLLNSFAFAVAFLTFFISTVIFNNDQTSLMVGLAMTGAVLAGLVTRLSPPRANPETSA